MKCVIVVDHTLPLGLIANASAVLAMSIGKQIDGIVGEDVMDRDGSLHRGITQVPIPVLKGDAQRIRLLRDRLEELANGKLFFVDFCDIAQRSKDYGHYASRLQQTPADGLNYLGIAICGPDRTVNSLTGNMGLLR
jgi:hypothetical protein